MYLKNVVIFYDLFWADCVACVEQFALNGGCQATNDDAISAAIPDGCNTCGAEADLYCSTYVPQPTTIGNIYILQYFTTQIFCIKIQYLDCSLNILVTRELVTPNFQIIFFLFIFS